MDNDNEISRDEDTTDYESDSDASQKAPVTEADPAGVQFEFKKIGKEVTLKLCKVFILLIRKKHQGGCSCDPQCLQVHQEQLVQRWEHLLVPVQCQEGHRVPSQCHCQEGGRAGA